MLCMVARRANFRDFFRSARPQVPKLGLRLMRRGVFARSARTMHVRERQAASGCDDWRSNEVLALPPPLPDAARRGGVMVRRIVIELETPGDSRTMFRLRIDANLIAEGLTAVQAHILVGEILERIALPRSPLARGREADSGPIRP